jgi:hypothetical protein
MSQKSGSQQRTYCRSGGLPAISEYKVLAVVNKRAEFVHGQGKVLGRLEQKTAADGVALDFCKDVHCTMMLHLDGGWRTKNSLTTDRNPSALFDIAPAFFNFLATDFKAV